MSYQDCIARAAEARRRAARVQDIAARDEYGRIAEVWDRLAGSMARNGLGGIPPGSPAIQ